MGTDARRDQAAEPNTDAIEKRLLANAEIARLIDNSDLASTESVSSCLCVGLGL